MTDKEFDNLIKQKLDHFEVDVPDACWDAISSALPQKSSASRVVLWRRLSAAAVLLLVVSLTGYLVIDKGKNPQLISQSSIPEKPALQKIAPAIETEQMTHLPNNELSRKTHPVVPVSKGNKATESIAAIDTNTQPQSTLSEAKAETLTAQNETESETKIAPKATEKEIEAFINEGLEAQKAEEPMILKAESHRNSSLSMMSALPGTSHSSSNDDYHTLRATSTLDNALDIISSSQMNSTSAKAQRRHSMPFSFGLLINKEIYKNLMVETGLYYTYLKSQQERDSTIYVNEIQRLHYLGIPLSLTYRFAKLNRFSFFVKAGGMVEKNIAGSWTDEIKVNNKVVYSTSTNSNNHLEDNLQWSLHTGTEIDYRLTGSLNFYLQPSFTYYPDNGSQIDNIRKKQQYEFSLQGGFKFIFETK